MTNYELRSASQAAQRAYLYMMQAPHMCLHPSIVLTPRVYPQRHTWRHPDTSSTCWCLRRLRYACCCKCSGMLCCYAVRCRCLVAGCVVVHYYHSVSICKVIATATHDLHIDSSISDPTGLFMVCLGGICCLPVSCGLDTPPCAASREHPAGCLGQLASTAPAGSAHHRRCFKLLTRTVDTPAARNILQLHTAQATPVQSMNACTHGAAVDSTAAESLLRQPAMQMGTLRLQLLHWLQRQALTNMTL